MQQQEIIENNNSDDDAMLITAKKAAKMLSISLPYVYVLADRGIIPGVVKMGRSVRFRKEDFDKWINAGCEGA